MTVFMLFLPILACCAHPNCELRTLDVVGKLATQSTTYRGIGAQHAVDGNLSTFILTDFHTDPAPWWRLNLSAEYHLGIITTILRGAYDNRFIGAVVRAGINPAIANNQQCGLPASASQCIDGAALLFVCDPVVMAMYVSVNLDRPVSGTSGAVLQMAEVTVEEYVPRAQDGSSPMRKSGYYTMLHDGRSIANPYPLSTKVDVTIPVLCAWSCIRNIDCTSFDYSQKGGRCRLYNVSPGCIITTPNIGYVVYDIIR